MYTLDWSICHHNSITSICSTITRQYLSVVLFVCVHVWSVFDNVSRNIRFLRSVRQPCYAKYHRFFRPNAQYAIYHPERSLYESPRSRARAERLHALRASQLRTTDVGRCHLLQLETSHLLVWYNWRSEIRVFCYLSYIILLGWYCMLRRSQRARVTGARPLHKCGTVKK